MLKRVDDSRTQSPGKDAFNNDTCDDTVFQLRNLTSMLPDSDEIQRLSSLNTRDPYVLTNCSMEASPLYSTAIAQPPTPSNTITGSAPQQPSAEMQLATQHEESSPHNIPPIVARYPKELWALHAASNHLLNEKQRHRILIRRKHKIAQHTLRALRGVMDGPQKIASRSEHAKRRQRGPRGQFLSDISWDNSEASS